MQNQVQPVLPPVVNGMYNELLYHLDLCYLVYHLYHQTLIWPMDPYYEQLPLANRISTANRRDTFMDFLRNFGTAQLYKKSDLHGPGQYQNFHTNNDLDTIITNYTRLNPSNSSLVRPEVNSWVFIKPPSFITDRIGTVKMCQYGQGNLSSIQINSIISNSQSNDVLYCFEGGTGSIDGKSPTAPAWSMMGFVLVRNWGNTSNDYDVHITFRGSRSGSASRALAEGLTGKGNPDWVTDMDFKKQDTDTNFSTVGKISRGFKSSINTIYPTIIQCLLDIQNNRNAPPKTIYVTGHSLGGALAVMFASLMGGAGQLPKDSLLSNWPWNRLRLITFAAPTTGDRNFTSYFNSKVDAHRILIDGDPITSAKLEKVGADSWGVHVGANTLLPQLSLGSKVGPGFDAHEVFNIRQQLVSLIRSGGEEIDDTIAPQWLKLESLTELSNLSSKWAVQQSTVPQSVTQNEIVAYFLKGCFPDFYPYISSYLNIYRQVRNNQKIKAAIGNINDSINNKTASEESILSTLPNLGSDDLGFSPLICICLALGQLNSTGTISANLVRKLKELKQ